MSKPNVRQAIQAFISAIYGDSLRLLDMPMSEEQSQALSNVLMGMTFGAVNIFSGSEEATEDTDTIASFIDGCNEAMRKQGQPLSQGQSEVLYGILAGITSKQRGSNLQDILAALGAKDAERLRQLLNLPQIPT